MRIKKLGIILLSIAFITAVSCYNFLNEVDREAPNYQGFMTVATVDEVAPESTSGTTVDSLQITVSECPEAVEYAIQISSSATDFSNPEYPETSFSSNIIKPSDAVLTAGTWYYRVRAKSSSGTWGAWSATASFEILAEPDQEPESDIEPEIVVVQDSNNIETGGSYSFISTDVGSTRSAVFTIENTGDAALVLSGSPLVEMSGTDEVMFRVSTQPSSTIMASDSTTFTVVFAPDSSGSKTVSISIANNDSDENPFIINLSGSSGLSAGVWDSTNWDECFWTD